jgi:hypothetical protein
MKKKLRILFLMGAISGASMVSAMPYLSVGLNAVSLDGINSNYQQSYQVTLGYEFPIVTGLALSVEGSGLPSVSENIGKHTVNLNNTWEFLGGVHLRANRWGIFAKGGVASLQGALAVAPDNQAQEWHPAVAGGIEWAYNPHAAFYVQYLQTIGTDLQTQDQHINNMPTLSVLTLGLTIRI